ncbi:hypothetical protein N7453_001963 [Penicillium expansum]|nr:hypothetical protein N7453_001963 [Penicillium expansum]
MPFLATVISSNTSSVFSPFAESIIFATIIRRVTTNTCDYTVEKSKSVWEKQISLSMIAQTRLKALSSKYQNSVFPLPDDPMHIFTMMLAHASVLYLYNIQHSLVHMAQNDPSAVLALEHDSLLAAGEILNLSTSILRLSFLKVHPFTPLLLAKCIEFYNTHHDLDEFSRPPIQQLYSLLKDMSKVNNIAREYLSPKHTAGWS